MVYDVIQFSDQIPERTGSGNQRIAIIVKLLQFILRDTFRQRRDRFVLVLTELPDKGAVHTVGTAIGGRFNIHMNIMSFRPDRFRAVIRHERTLTFKMSGFRQGEPDGESIIVDLQHGYVRPVGAAGSDPFFHFLNDFCSAQGGIAQIGAKEGFTGNDLSGKLHLKFHRIAGIADQMFSCFGKLFDLHTFSALFQKGRQSAKISSLTLPCFFLNRTSKTSGSALTDRRFSSTFTARRRSTFFSGSVSKISAGTSSIRLFPGANATG